MKIKNTIISNLVNDVSFKLTTGVVGLQESQIKNDVLMTQWQNSPRSLKNLFFGGKNTFKHESYLQHMAFFIKMRLERTLKCFKWLKRLLINLKYTAKNLQKQSLDGHKRIKPFPQSSIQFEAHLQGTCK